MHTFARGIYGLLLRLHPATFRNEFAREMALDFEETLHAYGVGCLFLDAGRSLARQWSASLSSSAPVPIFVPRPSLLDGNYAGMRDTPFTPQALGLGMIASATQVALCVFALSASIGHRPGLPKASAQASAPATRRNTDLGMSSLADGTSGFERAPSEGTFAAFACPTSFAAMPPPTGVSSTTPSYTVAGISQNVQPKPEMLLFHPSGPLLSYEVVKPLDPYTAASMVKLPPGATLSPLSMRRYIMNAYGAAYSR